VLQYEGKEVASVARGAACTRDEWSQLPAVFADVLLKGTPRIGRETSFCYLRVDAHWTGPDSRVQILPPVDTWPKAPQEYAEHPFVLEFPVLESSSWSVTNHRRIREHRRLTLLLNLLLATRTNAQLNRAEGLWALDPSSSGGDLRAKWLQRGFLEPIGQIIQQDLTPCRGPGLEEIDAAAYYEKVLGIDGKPLRVPTDLDRSITVYGALTADTRRILDRSLYWLDIAARQPSWSASFTALVTAVESLTTRGAQHQLHCPICNRQVHHESPGPTERFRAFFETYAPGEGLRKDRTLMYEMRSRIVHGGDVMEIDFDPSHFWTPPDWSEREVARELWRVTRVALRNWLRTHGTAHEPVASAA